MKIVSFKLAESRPLTPNISLIRLSGDTSGIRLPGEFIDVAVPGHFLRRPFSVMNWDPGTLELLIARVGSGTTLLQNLPIGTEMEIITGLGHGFTGEDAGEHPVLVGGGTGISPLLGLAKRLYEEDRRPTAVLGFRTGEDVCCVERFQAFCGETVVFTEDGSKGLKGRVTDAFALKSCTKLYSCGPESMLRALCFVCKAPGEFSMEARMGCGFGACMGCSIQTASGMRRICKDGPVFRKEELLWDG